MAELPPPPARDAAAGPGSEPAGWLTRFARPQVLLPVLAVALILAVLVGTPPNEQSPMDRTAPLKTDDAGPGGARGFYELAQRLGWPVRRQTTPYPAEFDSAAVYAVLDPRQPLTPGETHVLLDAVRRGAGLLVVVGDTTPLSDSLGFQHSDSGYRADIHTWSTCPSSDPGDPVPMWLGGDPALYRLWAGQTRPWQPADTAVFTSVSLLRGRRGTPRLSVPTLAPAAVGFPLGAGRVAVLSDDDLLRNDVIRVCKWGFGVAAVRELAWISRGGRPTVVFDEYHQDLQGMDVWGTVWAFLRGTAPGHALVQASIAALILLAAYGIRPVAPRAPKRIERRSSLEHVEALARAYAQAGATRVATRRLLRGLRRRHAHGVWRVASDERFLDAVAKRHPAVAADTRTLLDATGRSLTPAELLTVGQAVDHIDRTLDS
jgi:Domain of unknown function (DUF4350)